MKKINILTLTLLLLLGFASCQKAEINQNDDQKTHTVTFVAGAPETKTTVDIDGTTAKFSWTKADESRFEVYENGVKASETIGNLGADGIMTLTASFDGSAPESPSYQALYNTAVSSTQTANDLYDETADVLVSSVLTDTDRKAAGYLFSFKRESAIAKMTLKGLTDGVFVSSVTINSDKDIAGTYDLANGIFTSTSKTITITALSEISGGEATVWFASVPVEDATFTVTATAVDNEENIVATYTKTFTKTISLTRGDVKGFGVAMEKDAKVTPSYKIVFLNSSVNAGTTLNTTTKAETVIEEGLDYVLSQPFTQKTNCYYGGEQPLRVGKSGGAGSLVIALSELGQVPATRIILLAKQYSSGKAQVIGVNDSDKQKPGNDYTDLSYDLDGSDISSIKLDTDGYIYVKSITVEYGGTIKTKLAAPTKLAVSAEKVVSWDAVDGAASYDLTIGSARFTCETNSYNASEIADEYYDVAVVAVPSDTENYKNSAPATLTDAKFGTPTLATPTLNEGSIDEFSVNATWTVDARATKGYNCELFNGEIKVGESKTVTTGSVTFTGLDDGVTYTLKVNAIAVDGTKAYATSAVAEIELTTTPASKVSDVNKEDTYTIKNLTVYAIPNPSLAIIGDATGYILFYKKSTHGLSVGSTLDVAGPVVDYYGLWEFKDATASNIKTGSTPDYGEPVEATNEFLASFATKPLIKYIHAVGEQSGQDIIIGENKLHLSAANDETDGKTVVVYGFTYGYHSTNKYVQFVATSIAEDPTAPKLSVTPTSKTWESDGVDAATFTVTTNTEGEKDWTVSPETLDWAEITVNKTAGTITVTPKDANTTETAREATLKVTHDADNSVTETITLTQKAAGEKTEMIDFESASTAYTFWTFTNMTSQQTGSITANGGTYYGTTGGKTTASITTKNAIASPQSITFFVSKQSTNTTSSSWKLQVSSDNKTWTDVKTQSATSMTKGSWVEVTQDLSSYSNVYVRVYYTGSTAVRNIDDLTFTYSE